MRKPSNTKVSNYVRYHRRKFVGGNKIPQYAFSFMGKVPMFNLKSK